MSIRERKLGLFSAKMANHCSCRSALLQNKCSSSCSAVLQNKCRRSQIYTISSGPIDSKKSCSAKTSHGLSSVSKQERSSLAKSHLSKGSPIVKKRKPEEDLVDTIRKKPTVDCEMAARFSKDLMGLLMSHEYARVFSSPVDVVKLGLRDYFETVKYPMDLGTVKKKMELGVYFLDPLRFSCDVRLTFSNAMIYNPPTHEVHVMAKKLSEFFELRWKPILKKLLVTHRAWDEDLSSYHRLGTGLLASEKKPTSEPGNLCVNSITNKKTSSSPEVDERKRGVSLLCSRLSPGKHDRVSILLSRFSDINIKSQEQGLGVARKDRGKLDQRQKQFDLQTKEENGHLVKSKIEVLKDKFSAERKRKRELEREAARLAINKIEKTVDIYDYYNYRKDLVTYAILCSSGDESRLGEINERDLLEHLGLYLKMEDEEEEDRDL